MKLFLNLFLACAALRASASTIIFQNTNWNLSATYQLTNTIRIAQVPTNSPTVIGNAIESGLPIYLQTTNGLYTNSFAPGTYNLQILNGAGYPFNGTLYFQSFADTNTYYFTNVWLSGGNIFVSYPQGSGNSVTNGGISFTPTNGLNLTTNSGTTFLGIQVLPPNLNGTNLTASASLTVTNPANANAIIGLNGDTTAGGVTNAIIGTPVGITIGSSLFEPGGIQTPFVIATTDLNSPLLIGAATNPFTATNDVRAVKLTNAANTFGGNGALLTSLTSGNLVGALPAISGAALTALNGSQITSGTVADARLSANVFLLNAGNAATGANTFTVSTGSGTLFQNSNGVDNSITLQSLDPTHYSAMRFIDNNGQEQGAVGYANTNSAFKINGIVYDYLEAFGGQHPFFYSAGGIPRGGMSAVGQYNASSTDFVWYDNTTGSNVVFIIPQYGPAIASNGFTIRNLLTVGGSAWNTTSGNSNLIYGNLIDPTSDIPFSRIHSTAGTGSTSSRMVELTGTGTGVSASTYDFQLWEQNTAFFTAFTPGDGSGVSFQLANFASGFPIGFGLKPPANVSIYAESNIVSQMSVLAGTLTGSNSVTTSNLTVTAGAVNGYVLYATNGGLAFWGTAPSGGGGTNFNVLSVTNVATIRDVEVTNRVVVQPATLAITGSNVVVDAAFSVYRLTLTTAVFFTNTINQVDGERMTWALQQDATGNRTCAFSTNYNFGTDITGITLTTNAGKIDYLTMFYNGPSNRWDVIGFVRGY